MVVFRPPAGAAGPGGAGVGSATATAVAARYREAAERASAAAEREAASAAIGMFAELLSQSDGLAEIYAAQADRARIAGLGCEAAYDEVARTRF